MNKEKKKLSERIDEMFVLKRTSRLYDTFRRHPILQVFTEEYLEETRYYEFLKKNVNKIKLPSNNFDVDESVRRLRETGYQSNFHISIPFGSYDYNEQTIESLEHGQKRLGTMNKTK